MTLETTAVSRMALAKWNQSWPVIAISLGSPADAPARIEGERRIAEMEELARHSGDPRGR